MTTQSDYFSVGAAISAKEYYLSTTATVPPGGVKINLWQAATGAHTVTLDPAAKPEEPIPEPIPKPITEPILASAGAVELHIDPDRIAAWTAYSNRPKVPAHPMTATGWITPVAPFLDPAPATYRALRKHIQAVAKGFNRDAGWIVGRGYTRMTADAMRDWIIGWQDGNLRKCHTIEAGFATPDDRHPGSDTNPGTWHVTWASHHPGVIPAGVIIRLGWPAPNNRPAWTAEWVNLYCVKAGFPYLTATSSTQRKMFVNAHIAGLQHRTERELAAARERSGGLLGSYYTLVLPGNVTSELAAAREPAAPDLPLLAGTPASHWRTLDLLALIDREHLTPAYTWADAQQVVDRHRFALASAAAAAERTLTFTTAADQPDFGGWHRKRLLIDQHGGEWVFKPAPDPTANFRADVEHEANQLARRWGFKTADSRLLTHDGVYGHVQRRHTVTATLKDVTAETITSFTLAQLIELACEHLLDWALDNDDSHGDNVLHLSDGSIVGIDKSRAWRYYGGWPGLTGDHHAHTNCQLIYTALYTAIAEHRITRDDADVIYLTVIGRARSMQQLPDTVLAEALTRAQANRPHFKPSWYQRLVPDAPTTLDELITAATTRKNQLAEDMHHLWTAVYQRAGWTLPQRDTVIAVNPQGHLLHTGLASPLLHHQISRSRHWGTATFFAGTTFEDAHLLLRRERNPDGTFTVTASGKLHSTAATTFTQWCHTHTPGQFGHDTAMDVTGIHMAFHAYLQRVHNGTGLLYASNALIAADDWLHERKARLAQHPEPWARDLYAAQIDHYTHWLHHIRNYGVTMSIDDIPVWMPALPPGTPAGDVTVHVDRPFRAGAALPKRTTAEGPRDPIFNDGELCVSIHQPLRDQIGWEHGSPGLTYHIQFPTGERIQYRCPDCCETPIALAGELLIIIPDEQNIAESLARVERFLVDQAGLDIRPATATDLELFYWRHLAGIMDSRRGSARRNPAVEYQHFWCHVPEVPPTDPDDELHMWRTAFAAHIGEDRVREFLATGEHLPHFNHLDLLRPTQPGGRPYWLRIDTTDEACEAFSLPTVFYRNGPRYLIATGAALSCEARLTHLAWYKPGQSNYKDMHSGSSAFLFLRLCCHDGLMKAGTVFFRPQIMRRTSNYGFNGDHFGRIGDRRMDAPFNLRDLHEHTESNNEYMVKNQLSLLDDVEVVVFQHQTELDEAVRSLADRGITMLRGLPVATRFIIAHDPVQRAATIEVARFARIAAAE